MRRIKAKDSNGDRVDTVYPDNLHDVFAEGFGEIMIGATHIKMTAYQIRPVVEADEEEDQPKEIRQAALVLTMPIPQLIEAFTNILDHIDQSMEKIEEVADMQMAAATEKLRKFREAK